MVVKNNNILTWSFFWSSYNPLIMIGKDTGQWTKAIINYYFRLMLDQSKSELEKTTQQLSEKYESIDDEGNFCIIILFKQTSSLFI